MDSLNQLEWYDPRKKIWGFHVHQELPLDAFYKALVIQQECNKFLRRHDIPIDAEDVIKPGYGPHLDYMWELRVEGAKNNVLEKMGVAIAWLMCNRQGLSVFMHPVTWEEGNHREELKAHQEYSFFLGELPELDLGFFPNQRCVDGEGEAPLV